ncbi:MAG: hypothetical protein H0V40_10660 [Actinobacteria bacterium]|nr:hypothetical protein [Actinomycetota bacterium]
MADDLLRPDVPPDPSPDEVERVEPDPDGGAGGEDGSPSEGIALAPPD